MVVDIATVDWENSQNEYEMKVRYDQWGKEFLAAKRWEVPSQARGTGAALPQVQQSLSSQTRSVADPWDSREAEDAGLRCDRSSPGPNNTGGASTLAAPTRPVVDPWGAHDPWVPTLSTGVVAGAGGNMANRAGPLCKQPALPPGWMVGKASSGETYYYNPAHGASSWSVPNSGREVHHNRSLALRTMEVTTTVKVTATGQYKAYWDPNVQRWYRRTDDGSTIWDAS